MNATRPLLAVCTAALLCAPFPTTLQAQDREDVEARAASVRLGGRVHSQFQTSSVDGAVADVFLRRARLEVDIRVDDLVSGRLQPEFSGESIDLKDAYLRLTFAPSFRVTVGQFKRPFSTFELSSSTELPVIERDGRIEGLSLCPGVDGLCTFSRFTEKLQLDGRDRGLQVDGLLGSGLSYGAALTNGEGAGTGDVNDAKSLSGRLTWGTGALALGVFAAVHDHPAAGDAEDAEHAEHAPSYGMDVELGTWRSGFHLLAAVAAGDNWRVGPGVHFATAQALASWHVPLEARHLTGVEPLLRVSWGDPDRDAAEDAGLLLTPGVMVYFGGRNGVSANVDHYSPSGSADAEWSFKVQSYLYF